MILLDYDTRVLTCQECGHKWMREKNKGTSDSLIPKKCPKCGRCGDSYRKKSKYLFRKRDGRSPNLYVSQENKIRLMRRKERPDESMASIIDRILQDTKNNLALDVEYNIKAHKKNKVNSQVSKEAHVHLTKLKTEYEIKTFNEVLWRVLSW